MELLLGNEGQVDCGSIVPIENLGWNNRATLTAAHRFRLDEALGTVGSLSEAVDFFGNPKRERGNRETILVPRSRFGLPFFIACRVTETS